MFGDVWRWAVGIAIAGSFWRFYRETIDRQSGILGDMEIEGGWLKRTKG